MIKVCHMTSVHSSNDIRVFQKECVSLANAGYDTYLVATGESREDKGVHVIGIGQKSQNRIKRMIVDAKKVYKTALSLNADIYHFHDPELLPYGVKLAKKGFKVIWDSHEEYMTLIENKNYIHPILRHVAGKLFQTYYKSVLSKFSAVVIVTPGQEPLLRDYCKKICMVTNFPLVDENEEFILPTYKSKKLVFAGTIGEQWSHREIIRAIEKQNDVKYVLCGDADSRYSDSLKELKGWNQVEFHGRIPYKEVHHILADCTVGMAVLKVYKNSFGKQGTLGNNKLFEEMAAGLPVICSDFTLWKEIIDKYHCGIYVDPVDDKALLEAIRTLTSNPVLAKKMGTSGREAVLKEYNWKTQEKVLTELYSSLI